MACLKSPAQAVSASCIEEAAETTRRGVAESPDSAPPSSSSSPQPASRRASAPIRRSARFTSASTITEVALTVAVACTPGARPSSSTASRVTAAVIRCGPASISTSAITPSDSTETHHSRESVAGRQRTAGLVAVGTLGKSFDLPLGDPATVGLVARGAQLAGALPAAQRVGAHAEGAGGVAEEESLPVGHVA